MKTYLPLLQATLYAAVLAMLLSATGCAQMFTAKTAVSVTQSPDGTCTATYSSDKEQIGLEAEVCGGKVKVDKAGTQEAVIAAVLQSQIQILGLIDKLASRIPAK